MTNKKKGYGLLWRDIRKHGLWKDDGAVKLFLYFFLEAEYKPYSFIKHTNLGDMRINLKRGQLFTTSKKASEENYWSDKKYRRMRNRLASDEFDNVITMKTTGKGTIITVVNYDKYQNEKERWSPVTSHTGHRIPTY